VTLYRRLGVYESRLDSPQIAPQPALAIEPGELGAGDVETYMRLRPDTPDAEVRRRLARGDRCFVAWSGGELLSVRWLAFGTAEVAYLGLRFALPDGVAYPYDAFTPAELRGEGLSWAMGAFMAETVRGEGCRSLVSLIRPENAGGERLVARRGTIPSRTVGCLRLPGVRIPFRRVRPGLLGPATRLRD
jgi:hypothetical protein